MGSIYDKLRFKNKWVHLIFVVTPFYPSRSINRHSELKVVLCFLFSYVFDANAEAVKPIGNDQMIGRLYFGLIQQRIGGAFGRGGILGCGNGIYQTGTSDTFLDRDCKIKPADLPFIAVIVNTW